MAMRMTYAELQGKARILRSLTGFTPAEFEGLLPSFGEAWAQFIEETFTHKKRKRAYGAGRKPELEKMSDKLLFILVYFRQYPTQEVQGYLFDMGQTQANQWVHRLTGVLNQALGKEMQLPERRAAKLPEGAHLAVGGDDREGQRMLSKQRIKSLINPSHS